MVRYQSGLILTPTLHCAALFFEPSKQTTSFTPITWNKNCLDRDLDSDPKHVPVFTGQSLFNTKKNASHCCSLFSICYIAILLISGLKLSSLHGTKYLDPDRYLHRNLDNFALCKRGKSLCMGCSLAMLDLSLSVLYDI